MGERKDPVSPGQCLTMVLEYYSSTRVFVVDVAIFILSSRSTVYHVVIECWVDCNKLTTQTLLLRRGAIPPPCHHGSKKKVSLARNRTDGGQKGEYLLQSHRSRCERRRTNAVLMMLPLVLVVVLLCCSWLVLVLLVLLVLVLVVLLVLLLLLLLLLFEMTMMTAVRSGGELRCHQPGRRNARHVGANGGRHLDEVGLARAVAEAAHVSDAELARGQ
jgi:hypothetical protein